MMADQKIEFEILFDNAGGAVLQTAGRAYVHFYGDMKQLAEDVAALVGGANTADWDGNNQSDYVTGEYWVKNKDAYDVFDETDYDADLSEHSARNVSEFRSAMLAR